MPEKIRSGQCKWGQERLGRWMCCPPFAGELLRLGYLLGGHQPCHDIPIPDGFGIASIRRQAEPEMRLHIVLAHALAIIVHQAQTVLGGPIALQGSPAIPFGSFDKILRHSLSTAVHRCNIALCGRISLFGGPQIPFDGLCIALRSPSSFGIHHAKFVLSRCISLSD